MPTGRVRPSEPLKSRARPSPYREDHAVETPSRMAGGHAEIELRLLFHPEDLENILASPVITRHALDEWSDLDLTSVYYDTADLDLRRCGCALRIRTDGGHRLATLKLATAEALERTEFTSLIDDAEPDAGALSRLLPKGAIELAPNKPLRAMFSTQVRRHLRTLASGQGRIQLAVDHGQVVAGDRTEALNEIELELLDGSAAAIFSLGRDLVATLRLRPSLQSKSVRGFDLVLGTAPTTSTPSIIVERHATVDQMIEATLRSGLRHLLESQPAVEDGRNPEGVHQCRVALRRLLLVLGQLGSIAPSVPLGRFQADAKWLMSTLGRAREWDVFIDELLPSISRSCPVGDFDLVRSAAKSLRSVAYDAARAAINEPRTGRFEIELGLWIEEQGWRTGTSMKARRRLSAPVAPFAEAAVDRLDRRVRKRGRLFGDLSIKQRHRLRIAVKNLRYAEESYGAATGVRKIGRKQKRRLVQLQDKLGRYIDLSSLEGLVGEIVGTEMPPAGHQSAGALLGWYAGTLPNVDRELQSVWQSYRRACPS